MHTSCGQQQRAAAAGGWRWWREAGSPLPACRQRHHGHQQQEQSCRHRLPAVSAAGLSRSQRGPRRAIDRCLGDSRSGQSGWRAGSAAGLGRGPGFCRPLWARKRRLLHVRCDHTRNEVIPVTSRWPVGLGGKPRRPPPARQTVRGRLCMVSWVAPGSRLLFNQFNSAAQGCVEIGNQGWHRVQYRKA